MSFAAKLNLYAKYSLIDSSTVSNSIITANTISNTIIDMNSRNITNVLDPILQQDAATKHYVDNLSIKLFSISLSNISPVQISNTLSGCLHVMIKNQVLNGPCAIFSLTKNESSNNAHISRLSFTPGIGTKTMINIDWPKYSNIVITKTDSNYDGSYLIKINQL